MFFRSSTELLTERSRSKEAVDFAFVAVDGGLSDTEEGTSSSTGTSNTRPRFNQSQMQNVSSVQQVSSPRTLSSKNPRRYVPRLLRKRPLGQRLLLPKPPLTENRPIQDQKIQQSQDSSEVVLCKDSKVPQAAPLNGSSPVQGTLEEVPKLAEALPECSTPSLQQPRVVETIVSPKILPVSQSPSQAKTLIVPEGLQSQTLVSHVQSTQSVLLLPIPPDSENTSPRYIVLYPQQENCVNLNTSEPVITPPTPYDTHMEERSNRPPDATPDIFAPPRSPPHPSSRRKKIKITKCLICCQEYPSQMSYQIHKRLFHSPRDLSLCEFCGQLYTNKANMSSLRYHIRTQHCNADKNVVLKCKICNKAFTSSGGLRAHIRVLHKGVRRLCEFCGKKFSSLSSLKCHRRNHKGEKPYSCQYCEKAFVDKQILRMHERVHTKEKPCVCQLCGNRYTQISSLKVHVTTAHSDERPFVCVICSKRFVVKSLLNTHMKIHAKKGV